MGLASPSSWGPDSPGPKVAPKLLREAALPGPGRSWHAGQAPGLSTAEISAWHRAHAQVLFVD